MQSGSGNSRINELLPRFLSPLNYPGRFRYHAPPMNVGDPFLMGVNYWPRAKAMFFWRGSDAGGAEEFAMIRELHLTHVRLFLLWESFQPDPKSVSSKRLRRNLRRRDIAADLNLKLQPTFFTGHMSGPNWMPIGCLILPANAAMTSCGW